jgi:hypothetical protein
VCVAAERLVGVGHGSSAATVIIAIRRFAKLAQAAPLRRPPRRRARRGRKRSQTPGRGPACRNTSPRAATTSAASRHLSRTRASPRGRDRQLGTRPIVMARASNGYGDIQQAVALARSRLRIAGETPARGPTKRRCASPGRPSLVRILRSGGPFAAAGSGRRIVV